MKSFKKWIGIIEPEPIRLIQLKSTHRDLTEKQVIYLEQMISNYRNRGMAICLCDVERVVNMCNHNEFDDDLPTRLEGSD